MNEYEYEHHHHQESKKETNLLDFPKDFQKMKEEKFPFFIDFSRGCCGHLLS